MGASNRIEPVLAAAFAFLVATVLALPAALAEPSISTPRVCVAPNGQQGFPFMATALNLGKAVYVEQEFLLTGSAQAYVPAARLQADGRWNVEPNPAVRAP